MSGNQGWGQPQGGAGWGQQQQQPPPPPPPPQDQGAWPPPPPQASGAATKYCPNCGAVIDARAEICPNCGVRQPDAVGEGKSRPLAILLALLLGSLGVHRFYMGPIWWGVLYLVFFWTYLPAILAWFEAIRWLLMGDVSWAQKYGGPVKQSNGIAIALLWVLALLPLILLVVGMAAVLAVFGDISAILSEIEAEMEATS